MINQATERCGGDNCTFQNERILRASKCCDSCGRHTGAGETLGLAKDISVSETADRGGQNGRASGTQWGLGQ